VRNGIAWFGLGIGKWTGLVGNWAEEDGVDVRTRMWLTGSTGTHGKARKKGFGEGQKVEI
jgi:hypothetical protein